MFPVITGKIYRLLTKAWGQDGWILAKFLFVSVYGPKGGSPSTHTKEEQGQYSAILTEQASLVNGGFIILRENLSCRTQRVIPSLQESAILCAGVANHSARFAVHLTLSRSCPYNNDYVKQSLNIPNALLSTD